MSLIFQFAKSLLSDKIRNRFKTHSNLEHLQKSVEPSILPAEYGGSVSTKDCIISWKKELEENRATVTTVFYFDNLQIKDPWLNSFYIYSMKLTN